MISASSLVVCDHHRGDPEFALQLTDFHPNRFTEFRVEIRQRLVEEQHVRADDQCARARRAAACRPRAVAAYGRRDPRGGRSRKTSATPISDFGMHVSEAESDILGDGEMRK